MEIIYASTYDDMLNNMSACFQFKHVNMIEHGQMVSDRYIQLVNELKTGITNDLLPPQLYELFNKHNLLDDQLMNQYHVLHDCGKPLCNVIGTNSYPNHAEVSYNQIKLLFEHNYDLQFLVLHDMDFHTLKNDQLITLAQSKYGFSLYLTAWAELFANSEMFGGCDNVSFKIKRKKLIKCLKLFNF